MIHQFDVFRNPIRTGRDERPYVISLQHYHLDHLRTRIVAPLARHRADGSHRRPMPALTILDETLYLSPTEIVTLSTNYLRGAAVANLENYRREIVEAVDLVLVGI